MHLCLTHKRKIQIKLYKLKFIKQEQSNAESASHKTTFRLRVHGKKKYFFAQKIFVS